MAQIRFPVPRLLPITILTMTVLLVMKSATLVLAATSEAKPAVVAPAKAESGHTAADPHAKPVIPAPAPPVSAPTPTSPVPNPTVAAAPPLVVEPIVSDAERQLLTDLRNRRATLDARETALATREQTLAAVETRLKTRMEELTALQGRLETLERQRAERDDVSWRGLVKLYEAMKPRDAATIFNDLDLPVLLPVLDRMKEVKAALVLAAMQPERARQVTSELAQMRAKANSISPDAAKKLSGG